MAGNSTPCNSYISFHVIVALPFGTPSGKGLYSTVNPSSCPNTDTVCPPSPDLDAVK